MEVHPLRARRFLHVSDYGLGTLIIRVHEQGNYPGLGNQLGKQLEPFGHQLGCHECHPRDVAARPARLATRPSSAGSAPLKKTIGIVEVALFAARTTVSPPAAITSTLRLTRSAANSAVDHSDPPPSGIRSPR